MTTPYVPSRSTTLAARVLVVDDQALMRLLMRSVLEQDGYSVTEASDGLQALERLDDVDVVVMDVMMPGLDGISACRRIREQERALPVILVTAVSDREARIAGKASGADDFLTKPIDPAELCARVRVLARAKALADQIAVERSRLEAELVAAQDAVAHLERLATLGTLSAGVGHELKNLAGVILGVSLDLVDDVPSGREDGAELLARVGRHLASLGQNLMRLGNVSSDASEPVDSAQIVRQVHELMRRAGRLSGTTVALEIATCAPVHASSLELEQVLINLIGNAVDAVEGCDDRRISIRVDPGPLGVRLTVADSGLGMPPEVLARVFEPYFTTKTAGRGTGLGLPVVRQRVESWGGTIRLESTLGQGTHAIVDLRVANA